MQSGRLRSSRSAALSAPSLPSPRLEPASIIKFHAAAARSESAGDLKLRWVARQRGADQRGGRCRFTVQSRLVRTCRAEGLSCMLVPFPSCPAAATLALLSLRTRWRVCPRQRHARDAGAGPRSRAARRHPLALALPLSTTPAWRPGWSPCRAGASYARNRRLRTHPTPPTAPPPSAAPSHCPTPPGVR
jgi:hypothetical protein